MGLRWEQQLHNGRMPATSEAAAWGGTIRDRWSAGIRYSRVWPEEAGSVYSLTILRMLSLGGRELKTSLANFRFHQKTGSDFAFQ